MKRRRSRKRWFRMAGVLLLGGLLTFGLSGCGVALENRVFPLSMGVDYQNGDYLVYYGIPNLSGVTGQNKNAENQDQEKGTDIYRGKTMEDARSDFLESQENYLDMGHLKTLLLGEGLLENEEALHKMLQYLEETPSVAGNIYVFSCTQLSDVMAMEGGKMDSLGKYLTGIIENRPESHARQQTDLQDLYNTWHNREPFPKLLRVFIKDEKVFLENRGTEE